MLDDDGPCPPFEFEEHAASPLQTTATAAIVTRL